MQYSDTTTKLGIIQEEERLCLLGDGGISSNTVLLKQFAGYNNRVLGLVASRLRRVSKNNQWDDYNYTDYPDSPITMVVSTNNNTIPVASTGASVNTNAGIKGIYYLEADGSRTYLSPMGADDKLQAVDGTPSKYMIMGKSIFFDVRFSSACLTKYSSTFYVEFDRTSSLFAYNDTTKEAGFLSEFHWIIPLGASAIYTKPTNLQYSLSLDTDFYRGLDELAIAQANFDAGVSRRLIPHNESNE